MSEFLSAGYDDHLAKGLQLPFTTFIYLLYFIFTFFIFKYGQRAEIGGASQGCMWRFQTYGFYLSFTFQLLG